MYIWFNLQSLILISFLILGPTNPMHTSTPIIQTNNISMHFTTQQRSRERLSRWIESSDFTNEIQGNVPRFTNEIQSNIPRLQRRRRRNLVDEEDAAIFWQEALSQDSIEP